MVQGSFFMENKMKYQSSFRFSILCIVDGKIQEIPPGKIIECKNPINNKYMTLIEEERKIKVEKTYNRKGSKKLNTLDVKDSNGNDGKSI
jgi:hypothetical protein